MLDYMKYMDKQVAAWIPQDQSQHLCSITALSWRDKTVFIGITQNTNTFMSSTDIIFSTYIENHISIKTHMSVSF